jgi:NADH-quinone oxidoreductase subunit J
MTFDATNMILLVALLAAGVWTVMVSDLLQSAIGLAVSSAILALILYHLGGPLAAVFELSVCAGLITVVFIATISLTSAEACEDARWEKLKVLKRFVFLPPILAIVAWRLAAAGMHPDLVAPPLTGSAEDVRQVLWSVRRLDLLGQILIVLAGVFGVVVLFKGKHDDNGEETK